MNNSNRQEIIEAKRGVFDVLVTAIDSAITKNLDEIYIEKKIRVYGKIVTVVIIKTEYLQILTKAEEFFRRNEFYENCQICKDLAQKIS